VTGGDVLLRIRVGSGLDASGVEVRANGQAVPARHAADGSLLALAGGLRNGDNAIEARVAGGALATLTVTNYPITGPIISGPHQTPYLCQSKDFTTATGAPLGPALDEDCSAATRVDYVYLSAADGEFHPYTGPTAAEVARTTTLDGRTVPFVVRVQTGTVNRAIYESALLHDPADPAPDPWTRSDGWNGKLVYTHGGGCRSGWFRQGSGSGNVLDEGLLGMGYAVTSSSLNVFGNNCNDLLASETHIMVKERFVESYGVPTYTIGTGGSGGLVPEPSDGRQLSWRLRRGHRLVEFPGRHVGHDLHARGRTAALALLPRHRAGRLQRRAAATGLRLRVVRKHRESQRGRGAHRSYL
jgi:hypothetical protein